jgi:hypothetical protein
MNLTTDQINAVAAVIIVIIAAITGGAVKLTPEQVNTLIVAAVAIIGGVTAVLQNKQKKDVVAAMDPVSPQANNPAIIAALPERTWKMTDATRQWCLFDATPENRVKIEAQIAAAEKEHKVQYRVDFADGHYRIEYGLLAGGAGNPSGK